ncbi:MAG: hypothetical protein IJT91_00315 [Clostridia bacterium]|nr:hypothetical protein [Clostridia bacterium]
MIQSTGTDRSVPAFLYTHDLSYPEAGSERRSLLAVPAEAEKQRLTDLNRDTLIRQYAETEGATEELKRRDRLNAVILRDFVYE